jgi:hypothetical protein
MAPGIRHEPVLLQRVFAETFLGGSRSAGAASRQVLMRLTEESKFGSRDFAWPELLSDGPAPAEEIARYSR